MLNPRDAAPGAITHVSPDSLFTVEQPTGSKGFLFRWVLACKSQRSTALIPPAVLACVCAARRLLSLRSIGPLLWPAFVASDNQ